MEVTQTADDVAGEILIDGNLVPEITKRELNATISVADRTTVVLGGLILSRNAVSETKVPFLGDIPVIGNLFKFKSRNTGRSELVVLLTPYVLMTPAEARAESTRLYSANSSRQREWHTGWSDSPMGRMTDADKARYIDEWEKHRPTPVSRDLSVDLLLDNLGSTPSAPAPEPAQAPEERPRRRSLMGAPPAEEDAVIPVVEPAGEPEPEPDPDREAPAASGGDDTYSRPLPAR
jgi:hypothetical protein